MEGRFDVRPSSLKPQHADIDLHVHVAFKKNTIMRGKIESNTLATHQKNFGTLEEAVRGGGALAYCIAIYYVHINYICVCIVVAQSYNYTTHSTTHI